jgi:hypothetical protein
MPMMPPPCRHFRDSLLARHARIFPFTAIDTIAAMPPFSLRRCAALRVVAVAVDVSLIFAAALIRRRRQRRHAITIFAPMLLLIFMPITPLTPPVCAFTRLFSPAPPCRHAAAMPHTLTPLAMAAALCAAR